MSGQGRLYSVEDWCQVKARLYSVEDWCQVKVGYILWRTGVRSR